MFLFLLVLLVIGWHVRSFNRREYYTKSYKEYKFGNLRRHPIWKRWFGKAKLSVHIPAEYANEYPLPESNGPYIFCHFPHYVASTGHFFVITNLLEQFEAKVFSGPRAHMVAGILFKLPLLRQVFLGLGCLDVGKPTCDRILKDGMSMYVVPGGLQEQTMSDNGVETVFLKNRNGFVKLAIEHGATLIPVFCFGESKTYKVIKWFKPIAVFMANRFRIGAPLYIGKYGPFFGMLHKKWDYVYGKPIPTKQFNGDKSVENVTQTHELFIKELVHLYESNAKEFGNENIPLKLL